MSFQASALANTFVASHPSIEEMHVSSKVVGRPGAWWRSYGGYRRAPSSARVEGFAYRAFGRAVAITGDFAFVGEPNVAALGVAAADVAAHRRRRASFTCTA